MAIIKCSNNHYYDDRRNSTCPYCEKEHGSYEDQTLINDQQTTYYDTPTTDEDYQVTEAYGDSVETFERTIEFVEEETHNLLTVGWLVCMTGNVKGKSYVLHSGRNFAGRSDNMDIVLSDDAKIAREGHFSIVYDPKSVKYFAVSGSGYAYINNEVLLGTKEIYDGDELIVGDTKFIFIAFCKEGRVWK